MSFFAVTWRVVGRQKESHAGDIDRLDGIRQALRSELVRQRTRSDHRWRDALNRKEHVA